MTFTGKTGFSMLGNLANSQEISNTGRQIKLSKNSSRAVEKNPVITYTNYEIKKWIIQINLHRFSDIHWQNGILNAAGKSGQLAGNLKYRKTNKII